MSNPEIWDLREQIKRLETRLMGVEGHGKFDSINEATGFTEGDDTSSAAHLGDLDHLTNINYIPEVQRCNFREFKNRFGREEARYAVDVLVSGGLFEQEYLEEQRLRDRLFEHGTAHSRGTKKKTEAIVNETNRSNNALRNDQGDRLWNRRIRLQAPALLQILAKVQGETCSTRPRTYDRPFCTLLHFHPQVKQALAELEEKWAIQNEGHHTDSTATTPQDDRHAHNDEDSLEDSPASLTILRAYVKFIDEEVIPESQRYDKLNYASDGKLIFSDLCYLFKPGEYIYKQLEGEQSGEGSGHRMGQRIWRIYFVNDAIRNYNLVPPDHRKYSTHEPSEDDSILFTVHAYHIDYTGDEFCLVTHIFQIAPYEGWKPINALPIYPMRFNPHHEAHLDAALKVGEQVLQFIESNHAFYNGWTIMRSPDGGFATDANGVTVKHPEYINSEVMVDFSEAFQACPNWRPRQTVLKTEFTNKILISDDFPIREWSGKDRTRLLRETREIIPYRTGVHYLRRNKFVLEDPFLAAVARNHRRGQPTTKLFLTGNEKILVDCRVFAYVFRERNFAQLDVSKLTPSARNLYALEALKISSPIKSLIQCSVRGHFLQKEAEQRDGQDGMNLDIIRGKGTGLFILLHGVPGVGKTATAEAVAQANGKPLFKITCGDLGLTPDQIESSMRAVFRLASLWDCILLMDDVDTFFSQRSKGDSAIIKNALVSVFLRVLDYYSGILFMTTNRSGALDEAFKSRIHYKIYYPPLTKTQTIDIWNLNIQRLREINEKSKGERPLEIYDSKILHFAGHQFDDSNRRGTGQWNGRQIRNAFQVARSLAYYDAVANTDRITDLAQTELTRPVILDVKYFQMMHDITESFDHYMLEVFNGLNDKDLALEMEHRADHFVSNRAYRSAQPLEEPEDLYSAFNGTSSPLLSGQESAVRLRSTRPIGSRPPSVLPGSSQLYSENSPARPLRPAYGDPVVDNKSSNLLSGLLQPAASAPRERRPSQPDDGLDTNSRRGAGGFENGDGGFLGYSSGSRLGTRSRDFEYKVFGRNSGSYDLRRDARDNSEYDSNQGGYKMNSNEYNKRERS